VFEVDIEHALEQTQRTDAFALAEPHVSSRWRPTANGRQPVPVNGRFRAIHFPNLLREKPIIVTPGATSIDPELRMRYRHLAMVNPHCSVGPIAI
jgi:hypothetical protein